MKELQILKRVLLDKWGWISWLIANLIVSSPWIFFAALGIVTGDAKFFATATAIWSFQMLPIPLESVLVFVITIYFYTIVFKRKVD